MTDTKKKYERTKIALSAIFDNHPEKPEQPKLKGKIEFLEDVSKDEKLEIAAWVNTVKEDSDPASGGKLKKGDKYIKLEVSRVKVEEVEVESDSSDDDMPF
jgi:hypothetical protein